MRNARGQFVAGMTRPEMVGRGNPSWKHGKPKCEMCGKQLTNYGSKRCIKHGQIGRKLTDEVKKKLSLSKMGDKNPQFKDGLMRLIRRIRTLYAYRKWKADVLERDGGKCVWCGSKEQTVPDHIKPFSRIIREHSIRSTDEANTCSELWDISNGRTLCVPCHKSTDTWGRRASW